MKDRFWNEHRYWNWFIHTLQKSLDQLVNIRKWRKLEIIAQNVNITRYKQISYRASSQ